MERRHCTCTTAVNFTTPVPPVMVEGGGGSCTLVEELRGGRVGALRQGGRIQLSRHRIRPPHHQILPPSSASVVSMRGGGGTRHRVGEERGRRRDLDGERTTKGERVEGEREEDTSIGGGI